MSHALRIITQGGSRSLSVVSSRAPIMLVMSETHAIPQGHNRGSAEAPTPGNMYISLTTVSLFWGVRPLGLCCEAIEIPVTNPNVVRGGSPTVGRELLARFLTILGSLPPRFTTRLVDGRRCYLFLADTRMVESLVVDSNAACSSYATGEGSVVGTSWLQGTSTLVS